MHKPALAAAILLTATGALTATIYATRVYRKTAWVGFKPSSWLLQDARTGSGLTAAEARYALAGRLHRGGLSTEQANAFIEHLLQLQSRPWVASLDLYALRSLGIWFSKGQLSPTQA